MISLLMGFRIPFAELANKVRRAHEPGRALKHEGKADQMADFGGQVVRDRQGRIEGGGGWTRRLARCFS